MIGPDERIAGPWVTMPSGKWWSREWLCSELVEDMVSLMASFSAKVYGKRSAENRKRKKAEAAA